MESNEEQEYREKLNVCANSLADKMQILDTRDKLMRLKRSRQTDLATAVAVVGTCPDMCPELERYFRQETNQLSVFEMDPNTGRPDEYRMVKEYRRSGADQEEPLAHEMRPTLVLKRTMDYLCTNIMDLLDLNSSCGDWFDFVWSRTRSIRKDITQQHLCDEEAVALTEKCARFHIHCAATMCEQDLRDFDTKINEENLSNCLQTLKDLYYDLSLKDIYCPNEAEFRCYEVLLHLDDTSVLKDVQNYRKAIRDSPEVKLAVRALVAFQSNNYFLFFKLIDRCTYLMACALHKNFKAIRIQAMIIIRRSFTSTPSSTQVYPIQSLVNILGFDDSNDVQLFCNQLGLQCNDESVLMTRSVPKHFPSSNTIKAKRSLRLVEMKRIVSIGQTIHGSTLPPNPYKAYPLHNSFDNEGKLKLIAYDATDQKAFTSAAKVPADRPQGYQTEAPASFSQLPSFASHNAQINFSLTTPPLPRPPPTATVGPDNLSDQSHDLKQAQMMDQMCDAISSELLNEFLDQTIAQFLEGICSHELKAITTKKVIGQLFSSLLIGTVDSITREVAEEVIKSEKDRLDSQTEHVSQLLMNDIVNDTLVPQIKEISSQTLAELRQKSIDKKTEAIANQLLSQMVNQEIEDISSSVLSNEINLRQRIRSFREKRLRRLELKYFTKWRQWSNHTKRVRYLRQSFPAAPKLTSRSPTAPTSTAKHYFQSFDDNFEKSIERELKANACLNVLIEWAIKEVASEVFNCELSKRIPIFEQIRQNRTKRLQQRYVQKWKLFLMNKRLAKKRKGLPAAPVWRSKWSPVSPSNASTFDSSFESYIEPDFAQIAKKFKCDSQESLAQSPSPDPSPNISCLFEDELSESKKLTRRLTQELKSSPISEPISHSFSESEDVFGDGTEEEGIEVIEVFETQTDKMNRLKRLLSEEKDYFSLHKFVQFLADNDSQE